MINRQVFLSETLLAGFSEAPLGVGALRASRMHKAASGALAAFLLASPLLLLFTAVDNSSSHTTWQAQPSRFLDYARRYAL